MYNYSIICNLLKKNKIQKSMNSMSFLVSKFSTVNSVNLTLLADKDKTKLTAQKFIMLERFEKLFLIHGAKSLLKKSLTHTCGYNSRLKTAFIKNRHYDVLQEKLNSSLVGNKLKRFNYDHIAYCAEAKTYRSIRHKLSLPVRGQRTRTNAKTAKRRLKKKSKSKVKAKIK